MFGVVFAVHEVCEWYVCFYMWFSRVLTDLHLHSPGINSTSTLFPRGFDLWGTRVHRLTHRYLPRWFICGLHDRYGPVNGKLLARVLTLVSLHTHISPDSTLSRLTRSLYLPGARVRCSQPVRQRNRMSICGSIPSSAPSTHLSESLLNSTWNLSAQPDFQPHAWIWARCTFFFESPSTYNRCIERGEERIWVKKRPY